MSDQPELTPPEPDQPEDLHPATGEQSTAQPTSPPDTETAHAGEQSLPPEEDFGSETVEQPDSLLSRITAGGWSGRAGTIVIAVAAAVFIMLLLVIGMGLRPGELATLRQQNALLQTQVAAVDVEVADLVVMVEAGLATNQAAIATVAASQAGQEEAIAELTEHSERLYTFLEVLGEVANRTVAGEDPRLSVATDTVLLRQTPAAGEAAAAEEATSTSVTQPELIGPPRPTRTATPTSVSR